ncbi:hypothetical protein M422DRAFT_33820 [Sphaerobolus stellatus SS14]|uniref:AB hydrolase-1 domain-containing protein n=1 Tax=Sphaerobolus stellatus (strain SS14) TaxID=990650 RepID=A0A0C9VIX5_SPHS4|nr:hypothetical protein M422DRAFT_33820 [Sphaerobolus stellatus SS14]
MSFLRVGDDADSPGFLYYDSGAPEISSNYTTIFLIHGHTYHSPIFERLLPLAHKFNLRIVAVTRRDYVGSTPFSQEELDLLRKEDADVKLSFIIERAQEMALFMDKFVAQNKLPKAIADGSGGVAIAGWSLGNLVALSVVGLADHFPKELAERLEPYLRRVILYECPYYLFGFPPSPKAYHPLKDPAINGEEKKQKAFANWVSGYFKHPGLAVQDSDALEYVTPSSHKSPTDSNLTDEEKARTMDHAPGPRSEDPFLISSPGLMAKIRDEVFYSSRKIFPKANVKLVWGEETVWSVPYGVWELEKYLAEMSTKQPTKRNRPVEIVSIPETNHFVQWDDPEKLLKAFADSAFTKESSA